MNSPMASWLRRSWRIARTIRGENWPIASCTATRVSESTTLVSVTSDVEATVRIVCTDAAEPVTDVPTTWEPEDGSTDSSATARPMPASTQGSGTSHSRDWARWRSLKRFTLLTTAAPRDYLHDGDLPDKAWVNPPQGGRKPA